MCAYGFAYGKVIRQSTDMYMQKSVGNGFEFVLLYSTLGYELNATKRALLRAKEFVDPNVIDINQSVWRLLRNDGMEVMSGSPVWLGVTFGVQLWEIDFSDLRTPGFYRISVELKNREGAEISVISTLPFEVRKRLHSARTFFGISIRNAEAREALLREGGGLYDCNSTMGEGNSHGVFLAGLVNAYVRGGRYITPADRGRLVEAADRTLDYLMLLHNDKTGEIEHQYPSRHIGKLTFMASRQTMMRKGRHTDTMLGLFGIVSYVDLFKEVDPVRAERAFNKALKSAEYLEKIGIFPSELKTSVYYHLFKYSGDEAFKNLAISALNDQLKNIDLRSMFCGGGFPYFEGLYYCAKEFKDNPNHSWWIERAKEVDEQYFQPVLKKNGFHVIPQIEQKEEREWDDMKHVPASRKWGDNTRFATRAIDAIFLAEVTGDHSLEKIASAELGWITGLNPGVPGEMVTNPPTEQSLVSAAFIMNLDVRHVKPWSWWEWTPTKSMMSIVNGFVIRGGKWAYVDEVYSAETFIMHDGAYLYAICVYEDYLNKTG